MTHKIFCIESNISSKLLELETSNLEQIFIWGKPCGRSNNFPQKGHGLGQVTPQFLAYNATYLQNYLNFLRGAVIVGDPSESVDVATLEPRAKNGQAVRCTECE